MDRTAWTDDRLDDLAARSERNFELLGGEDRSLREETRDEIHGLRDEVHGLRDETRAEGRGLREEMAALRDETRAEGRGLREEMTVMRVENRKEHLAMRADISAIRSDLSAWQRQITQIGWAMAGTLIAAVVALVIGTLA